MTTAHPLPAHLRSPRAARRGLIAAGLLAGCATLGPLVPTVANSFLVQIQVGVAAHLLVPVSLPAGLDGMGATALIYLAALRPRGRERAWAWFLVLAALAASMAANGVHAVSSTTDAHGVWTIELDQRVAFAVSTVPPASAAAALHLLLRIFNGVRDALRAPTAQPAAAPAPATNPEPPVPADDLADDDDAQHPDVVAAALNGQGYRPLMEKLGWGRPRTVAALKAARARLSAQVRTEAVAA
jgi:hypothetical protein